MCDLEDDFAVDELKQMPPALPLNLREAPAPALNDVMPPLTQAQNGARIAAWTIGGTMGWVGGEAGAAALAMSFPASAPFMAAVGKDAMAGLGSAAGMVIGEVAFELATFNRLYPDAIKGVAQAGLMYGMTAAGAARIAAMLGAREWGVRVTVAAVEGAMTPIGRSWTVYQQSGGNQLAAWNQFFDSQAWSCPMIPSVAIAMMMRGGGASGYLASGGGSIFCGFFFSKDHAHDGEALPALLQAESPRDASLLKTSDYSPYPAGPL